MSIPVELHEPYIPVELYEPLKRRECVLFVGSGLSVGLPTWKKLMDPLAKELEELDILEEDPRYIAEYYKNEYGRKELEEKVVEQLNRDVPLTEAHRLLNDLPLRAVITTNYDHVLERALSKKIIKVVDGREAPLARSDQLPLIKMHGDLDAPSTMVLTTTDYNEYSDKHRALITYLLGFLISYNFFFVGFGLRDPNFDNIYSQMHSLFKDTQRVSFAVIKDPPRHEVKRLKVMGIEVIPIKDYDEIPRIFEEMVGICAEKVTTEMDVSLQQLESVQNTFCEVVERQNKWLDPRGIFQFERMPTRGEVELEDIYVVPRLVKQVVRKRREERQRKPEEKETAPSMENGQEKMESVEEGIEEYLLEKQVELPVREVLSDAKNSHMVILGDPGMGKTCLLQYIALKASTNAGESLGIEKQLLPVLIPLREYPQLGERKMFKEFVFHYIDNQICPLPENVLKAFLEQNSFFFLLDGLDEVVSEFQRIEVSRQVERFMDQYPHTRMVLTSKPAGYAPAKLAGRVPHFTLADFNESEIREFLVKWFTFLDKIEEEKFDVTVTERKACELANIILRSERILYLARNPLLLTILVQVHRVGRNLPERRAEFYDLAVKTVIGSWDTWKNLQFGRHIPDQDTVLAILEKTGFRLHSEKKNVVETEKLKIWVKEAMKEEMGHSTSREIADFIWMLKERAGLLVEKGPGLYGFVHLTFQEYFAARYIALGLGMSLAGDLVKRNLYSSRWREVFLLAAAVAPPKQADLILDSALSVENPFEDYIHSNVMTAGLLLADLPRVDSRKRKGVLDRLISLTTSGHVDLLRVDALEVLTEIGRASPLENPWAMELLRDEDPHVRGLAVEYFTAMGGDAPAIREHIFGLLRDEDPHVRERAVKYFTAMGTGDPDTRERFSRLLRDEDPHVRRQAVEYFTAMGGDAPAIRKRVFGLLRDGDPYVRRQAVEYFTTLRIGDPDTRKGVSGLLSDGDSDVRKLAVKYFTALGIGDPEIRKRVFGLLSDGDANVRRQAVEYFTAIGGDALAIRKHFFGLLSDGNWFVRKLAVEYFTALGGDDPDIREHIFGLLSDGDANVRRQAVEYFTVLRKDAPDIREHIFGLLRDGDLNVRERAVKYFTVLRIGDPDIRERFFRLLSDGGPYVRRQAVEYFTAMGGDAPAIRKRVFGLLSDGDSYVRRQAVEYFTALGRDAPDIRERFFGLLSDETYIPSSDKEIQDTAVEFLSRYAREESLKKAPILFASTDNHTRRGAYKLMKALIQTHEK